MLSATRPALGKEIFKQKNKKLCRVPSREALGKEILKKIKNFAECHPGGARQRKNFKKLKNKKLCRVSFGLALGKATVTISWAVFFAEGWLGTRQKLC